VAAPVVAAALAAKPEFAMGGALTPGTPYIVGESPTDSVWTMDQVRALEDAWEKLYRDEPQTDPFILDFLFPNNAPHKA
jgi:hypothetical protein